VKQGIHPRYINATVTCACGSTWTTRSTKPTLSVDVCSTCHPFYTGEQRIVDTEGQVERFMKRMESAASAGERASKRQLRLQKAAEQRKEAEAAEAAARAAEQEAERARRREAQERNRLQIEAAQAAQEAANVEAVGAAVPAEAADAPAAADGPATADAATDESAS
jgi:large subunit ribosomal protein L31